VLDPHLRLALEATPERVRHDRRAHRLERDVDAIGSDRAVDDAHPAFTEQPLDSIPVRHALPSWHDVSTMRWLAAVVALLVVPALAHATTTYQARVPGSSCGDCHVSSAGGGARNAFGSDFASAGYTWSASLRARDSDGDGWTNEQEINGGSNPGVRSDTPFECGFGNGCSVHATCSDMAGPPGSYTCACRAGWTGDGRTCTDVDECTTMTASCAPGTCANTPGSWTCACPDGWVLAPGGQACARGCGGDPCGIDAIACSESTRLGYECACAPGEVQYLDAMGNRACGTSRSPTQSPPGSWWDSCCGQNAMWGADVCVGSDCVHVDANNINELLDLSNDGFSCMCEPGFCDFFRTRFLCEDRDECADDPCGAGTCENLALDYRCTCPPGSGGMHGCWPVADCDAGTVECCARGYTWDAALDRCVDLDECTEWNVCNGNACVNRADGYDCTCAGTFDEARYYTHRWGWIETCVDRDDCAFNPCGPGTCTDRVGGYDCACNAGFELSAGRCVDIDECMRSTPCAPGACTNGYGGYTCACPSGYRSAGGACANIDECAEDLDDCVGVPCFDLPGSFGCGCAPGYVEIDGACADVDECADGTATCVVGRSTCRNTDGSYVCDCATGYEPGGGGCEDIDECARDEDGCDAVAECVNETGAYRCVCPQGTMLVGLECRPAEACAGVLCGSREVCVAGACECETGYEREDGACRAACGDAITVVGEECDDGNDDADDGCSACTIEGGWACHAPDGVSICQRTCGDGLVDVAEECDEGSGNDDVAPNACRTNCRRAGCGDGVIDDGESCDDGDMNDDATPNACRTTCAPASCGDGVVDDGEACDPRTGECSVCSNDGGTGEPPADGGCSCRASRAPTPWWLALVCFLALARARRRRSNQRMPDS
jgi:MYXO-CTERM domain-containing protein